MNLCCIGFVHINGIKLKVSLLYESKRVISLLFLKWAVGGIKINERTNCGDFREMKAVF